MNKYILFGLIILTMGCSNPAQHELVIQNVGLFDGYEDLGMVNIAINSDTIAVITTNALAGDSIIDASGKYMIPGLVNAHVHASDIEHLSQGYSEGILYLLNMHTGLEEREADWKKSSIDSLGLSTLYGSGHAATVPGGHPTQFSPDMETISDSLSIEDWLENRTNNGVDYIKIIRDNHEWMGEPALPTLDYETIEKLIVAAHQKEYKVVVHANTVEEMTEIAKFEPDGFVHMLDYKEDYPVPESYYRAIANSGAFIIPTGGISLKEMQGAPPFIVDWLENNLLDSQQRAEIIRDYNQNGIMLVAGTDAQEGQMNFSDDYFLELELYKMAGLSNLEILKAATGNAAKAFPLPIGELKVGGQASFVLLDADPLNDISNLKKVNQIWKNGKTQIYD